MRQLQAISVFAILAITAACAPAGAATSTPGPTALPATATLAPPATSAPTSMVPNARVIYDFQELACQATWTNNGQNLPCPANIYEDNVGGYVSLANESYMEGTILERDSALETHPAFDGRFYGIFGAYPPISIVSGDEFRATIGCRDGVQRNNCDVEFSLEYYDSNGNYVDSTVTGWRWNEIDDGQVHEIRVDLSALAGETVRLVLVVRDNGDPTDDNALWLHPQLWRLQ